jgi:hypothetical protein
MLRIVEMRRSQQASRAVRPTRAFPSVFAASQHWGVSLHVNKGLAGAPADAIAAARDTAMTPAVLDAVALVISGAEGPPAYPGVAGQEPDLAAAREHARAIDRAMTEIRGATPGRRRRAISSSRYGGNPFGVRTTRSCLPCKTSTIPTAYSSSIMASAVNVGVPTPSRDWPLASVSRSG